MVTALETLFSICSTNRDERRARLILPIRELQAAFWRTRVVDWTREPGTARVRAHPVGSGEGDRREDSPRPLEGAP